VLRYLVNDLVFYSLDVALMSWGSGTKLGGIVETCHFHSEFSTATTSLSAWPTCVVDSCGHLELFGILHA